MIHGIGADIVEVERISELCRHYGDRFQERILTLDEMQAFDSSASPMHFLAKRFAAKEAFSKALGLGLRGPMTLLSLQVLNDARGRPVASARNELEPYLRERGLVAHVSLSDEVDSAVAFVILEQKEH